METNYSLCHIGFVVRDMDKELKKWVKLGSDVLIPPTNDDIQGVSCCILNTVQNSIIELVAPIDINNSPLSSRLKNGGGLDHVCYFVDDIAESLNEQREFGAIVLVEPVYGCVWNRMLAFLMQPTGLVLELIEKRTSNSNLDDPLAEFADLFLY